MMALVAAAGTLVAGVLLGARGTARRRGLIEARLPVNHVHQRVSDDFIQSVLFDGEGPDSAVTGVELIVSQRREAPWGVRSFGARHRPGR
jgi:hypothetical protein